MIQETITVPAHRRLDISAYGNWPRHVYRIAKKSAGQWFWRQVWDFADGQVYQPGRSLSKTSELYFGDPKGSGHAFFAEPKPFKLRFKVEERFRSYPVVGCISDERGIAFTDPTGEKVCGFNFTWDSSHHAYPAGVQLWV
jgi:hypothetical protein